MTRAFPRLHVRSENPKNTHPRTSNQDQEPEGDIEAIPTNPSQDLPTYLNPVTEKQKVEEYIKLILHEHIGGSLILLRLNFDQLEEWINPPPQYADTPTLVVTPTDTPTSQSTLIKEVNRVLLQQILNLKLRLILREVQSYIGTFVTDNPELQPIFAEEIEFILEELLKLNIQPWHDVLRCLNGGLPTGYRAKIHTHIPHMTTVPKLPEEMSVDICEAHFESVEISSSTSLI